MRCDELGGEGAQPPCVIFMMLGTEVKSDTLGGIMSVVSKVPRETVFV